MFKFLFGSVSLKKLVMKRINAKINAYQEALDNNIKELNENKENALVSALADFINVRNNIKSDYNYNKEKLVDTHVNNLLNKII